MRSSLLVFFLFAGSLLSNKHSFSQSLQPVLTAIKNNDLAEVNSLLNKGVSVSGVDDDGDNVLMYAALYSTVDCLKLLLQKGADPNAKNKLGETAIMWCSNDIEKTKLLLDYKAEVNTKTNEGNTAFLVACVGNAQHEMIKLYLQNGADPLLKNNRNHTSLMRVAIYGDTSSARLLLSKGVDVNAKKGAAETALFYAIKSGNKGMVLWLLANGADANVKDSYQATALSYAVIVNDMDMVNALLEKTKGLNEQDIDGMSILMWAVYSEYDNPAIIQALLDKGAALHLKDKKGNTALGWALKKGNTPTVSLLRRAGAK
ncbi:MAG: ankyrin repeat domain-containing protein [Chitinophagaceae bacterium]